MFDKALIVVDMQYDFVNPNGSLYVLNAENLIEPINNLIHQFVNENQLIIYTQDWHKKDSKIFNQWPEHCIQNTKGAEIVVDIPKPADSVFIKKGMYDFENYGAFEGEPCLDKILKLRGIKELHIVGVAGDYCVYWTALQGLINGYKVFLHIDKIKSINDNEARKLYKKLKDKFDKQFEIIF